MTAIIVVITGSNSTFIVVVTTSNIIIIVVTVLIDTKNTELRATSGCLPEVSFLIRPEKSQNSIGYPETRFKKYQRSVTYGWFVLFTEMCPDF